MLVRLCVCRGTHTATSRLLACQKPGSAEAITVVKWLHQAARAQPQASAQRATVRETVAGSATAAAGLEPRRCAPRTVSASGEGRRCARLRTQPRVQRAWCSQERGGEQLWQSRVQRQRPGRRRDCQGVRMNRAIGAMLRDLSIPGRRYLLRGTAFLFNPLGAKRSAHLDEGRFTLRAQRMRHRWCERAHQDGQYGNPGGQETGCAMKAHPRNCIDAVHVIRTPRAKRDVPSPCGFGRLRNTPKLSLRQQDE